MKKLFNLKKRTMDILSDRSGDQIVGTLVVVLISIIVGGIVLTLFSDTVAEIWSLMVDKMKTVFNL